MLQISATESLRSKRSAETQFIDDSQNDYLHRCGVDAEEPELGAAEAPA